jgi:ABC-type cobalamin/Fe3+-siderophores transport system ATPase subunit
MPSNESQQAGRTLVVVLGARAAGKSTLIRIICGDGGVEHTAEFDCYDRLL